MISFIIGLLTLVLLIDCLLVVLLVLIQLPKKEAGAGLAFGSGTTDALFGAGSGNALTKITKYCTGIFFVLVIVLSTLQSHRSRGSRDVIGDALRQSQTAAPSTGLLQTTNVKPSSPAVTPVKPAQPGPATATNPPSGTAPANPVPAPKQP